jgi:hypothetical protein
MEAGEVGEAELSLDKVAVRKPRSQVSQISVLVKDDYGKRSN